jgi:hypothetical protein
MHRKVPFPDESSHGVKVATHHLTSKLTMNGAIPLLPSMPLFICLFIYVSYILQVLERLKTYWIQNKVNTINQKYIQ